MFRPIVRIDTESEYSFFLLLSFIPWGFSLTYENSSPPADNSFGVENIWEKMSPIWDYFELNDVNSDEAAGAFHYGSLNTSSWEWVEKSIQIIWKKWFCKNLWFAFNANVKKKRKERGTPLLR